MLNLTTMFPARAGANGTVNQADLALLRLLAEEESERQERYRRLRLWYGGNHNIPLTPRQEEYLAVDRYFEFAVNMLQLPVKICADRLTVIGFNGPPGIGGDDGLLMQWWRANRMDATQRQVHQATIVDGDTYVLVEWDEANGRPAFYHHAAFDGTSGMKVRYGRDLRLITSASKRWTEERIEPNEMAISIVNKLNGYLPGEVRKYEMTGGGWKLAEPPILWEPGVVPVSHFRWDDDGGNYGTSKIGPLIPIQELINKGVLDAAEVRDKNGFPIIIITGAAWPADAPELSAGAVFGIVGQGGQPAAVNVIPMTDTTILENAVDTHIVRMAQIADIPIKRFQIGGVLPSAEGQNADDEQLVAQVRSQSVSIGNSWEDMARIALRLNEVYGNGPAVSPDEDISVIWGPFERVDRLAVEERRANILALLVNAGVSIDGALALPTLGYTEEEQARMLRGDFVPAIEQ